MHAMKKTLVATLLAVTSGSALAANSVDVKVIGTINPVACTPSLGSGGQVDYGNISPDALSADKVTVLSTINLPIQISCDAKAKIGLKIVSQRPGSVAGSTTEYPNGSAAVDGVNILGANIFHGLGESNGKKIGGYAMAIKPDSVSIDGAKADGVEFKSAWQATTSGNMMANDADYAISWATVGETKPVEFKEMNGTLSVAAFIDKKSNLDVTKPIALDGLSSIELVYL